MSTTRGSEPPRPPNLPEACDVAVVGDSLTAIVVATELAASGARVVRMSRGEDRAQLGHGLLFHGLSEHPWRLLSSLGESATAGLYTTSARGIAHLAKHPGVTSGSSYWAAVDEREVEDLHKSTAALRSFGQRCDLLTAAEANAALGAEHLTGALRLHHEGTLDLPVLLRSLDAAALAAGVTTVHAQPLSIEQDAGGLVLPTNTTPLRAELVVCADDWRLGTLDAWFADKLSPWREQALLMASTAAPPLPPLRAGYAYTFARSLASGQTLVAGARWASPHLQTGETDPTTLNDTIQAKLEDFAQRFLPQHSSAIERRWAWIETKGCDGLPVLGPLPGRTRVVSLCGFSGNDSALGVGCALEVADLLVGNKRPSLPAGWSAQRFV